MKTIELLELYKSEILENLNEHACMFKLIGTSGKYGGVDETPRYYNVGGYDKEKNIIKFRSTQKNTLGFDIFIKPEHRENPFFWERLKLDNKTVWKWFKEVRTEFLKEYHPTISTL